MITLLPTFQTQNWKSFPFPVCFETENGHQMALQILQTRRQLSNTGNWTQIYVLYRVKRHQSDEEHNSCDILRRKFKLNNSTVFIRDWTWSIWDKMLVMGRGPGPGGGGGEVQGETGHCFLAWCLLSTRHGDSSACHPARVQANNAFTRNTIIFCDDSVPCLRLFMVYAETMRFSHLVALHADGQISYDCFIFKMFRKKRSPAQRDASTD